MYFMYIYLHNMYLYNNMVCYIIWHLNMHLLLYLTALSVSTDSLKDGKYLAQPPPLPILAPLEDLMNQFLNELKCSVRIILKIFHLAISNR